jgi:WD40 repeat protein
VVAPTELPLRCRRSDAATKGSQVLSRLFLSHASADNSAAVALGKWLAEVGYIDLFLDSDPDRGLVPGDHWITALRAAADRCEAVLCLVSPAWLASSMCRAEFNLARLLHKRIFGLTITPLSPASLPPEMAGEWQLCELAGPGRVREFRVEDTIIAFREVGLDMLRRGLERAGLDGRAFPWPPPDEPHRAPYRGLLALEPKDAAIFFGRDAAIIRGMRQIRDIVDLGVDKLLVVLGASGAGKSSFLRAGLLPRLCRDDAHFLALPVIRPQHTVVTGSFGLAASLCGAFAQLGAPRALGPVRTTLATGEASALGGLLDELIALARARLVHEEDSVPTPTIILPLDQAEELFTAEGAAETAAFLPMLTAVLASDRRVLVIATMRTDRFARLQDDGHLPEVRRALLDLPPMPPAEFKSVIEGPARRSSDAGRRLDIDPALTEALMADAAGADTLPLLGFTLERLWIDYAAQGRLTADDYRAMGGMQGSIEAAVAAALAFPERPPAIPVDTSEQRSLLRAAFVPWLARVDPATGAPMRRPARANDIPPASRAVVERFIAARLLVADRRNDADVIEVAHESLLRQWPTLLAWLDADSADLKLVEELDRGAAEWDQAGRRDDWLDHRADRLDAAERLLRHADYRARLGEMGILYVEACKALTLRERAAREAALSRQAKTQRRMWWALAAVAITVFAGAVGTLWQLEVNLARQTALDRAGINLVTAVATSLAARGNLDGALRIAGLATQRSLTTRLYSTAPSPASAQLAATLWEADWRLLLHGHTDGVTSVAYSPDGRHIVTASLDNTARVWDAASGRQIGVLRGHEGQVRSAAYSPHGEHIVTAAWDGTARIWDAASGQQIAVLHCDAQAVYGAAYSPDDTRIITASDDHTAIVWNAATGQRIAVLRGHEGAVLSAAFSPDGAHIVTASWDSTAIVWDAATGRQIAVLRGHQDAVLSATYSPDGTHIVTASHDNSVRVWSAASGAQILVLSGHEDAVNSAAFSPDGTRIVTASDDHTARVWDSATGQPISTLLGQEYEVKSAAYSPDGTHIVTASRDTTARVWNTASDQVIAVLKGHEEEVSYAAFSPDGTHVVTASYDNTGRIWDAATGRLRAVLSGHKRWVVSATYSPDGGRIVTASWDKTARIWDATSGQQLAVLDGHQAAVNGAAFSPNGTRIVTASRDGTARIWDAASGQLLTTLRGHEDQVWDAAFSPDGTQIVTASWDRTARIWDVASGRQINVLRGHEAWVESAAFSPDGTLIATGSADRTARLWDAASGRQIGVLRGHTDLVQSATFSPDGARIATASDDGTARVWGTASLRQIAVLRGHSGEVDAAAYSPDGTRIVTASQDTTAVVWDVRPLSMSPRQLLTEMCTNRLPNLSTLTRAEMDLLGFPTATPQIDVCSGVAGG